MRRILVDEINYKEFKQVQKDNPEVFYENGMRFFRFSTEDGPFGLINIWCKKNVINTRNFYIYKQERNKNLTKVLLKEILLLTQKLYPNTKTLWWSTTFDSPTIEISEMLHENKVIEKDNPNRFGFRDDSPCYLFWSDFNKLIDRVMMKKFNTTGSTGNPKEVLHTTESINSVIRRNIELFDLKKSDILLDFVPRHTIGSYIMARPMEKVEGTIHSDKFSPEVFVEMLSKKPTKLILIPTMVRMLKESGLRPNCSSIEHMLIGAEETSIDDIEFMLELGVQKVMHGYGSTECIPVVMGTNFMKGDDIHLGMKLIGGWDIMLDKTLHLRGESMLSNHDKDFFDTKDIFTFDGEFFYWKGRSDNIIKKSGWKVVKNED